ncbi:MAG: hypothetical protein ACLQGT_00295 [Terracidiphilus sp.]
MTDERDAETLPAETQHSCLVKACGEFWNPEYVKWESPYELLGKREPNGADVKDVNMWGERGVYILYQDRVPVYVGKADKTCLGDRLAEHWRDWRKMGRWNSFSWFGVFGLLKYNPLPLPEEIKLSPSELIAGLEALLIAVIDPGLNSKRERLKDVIWLYQSEKYKPVDRLASIEKKLDHLLKKSGVS